MEFIAMGNCSYKAHLFNGWTSFNQGHRTWLASGIDEEGKYHGHLLLNENDKLAMTNQGYGVYDILKKKLVF